MYLYLNSSFSYPHIKRTEGEVFAKSSRGLLPTSIHSLYVCVKISYVFYVLVFVYFLSF